ncbi:molybdopterin-guanine dinucleotide biosynthesis protein B [bacterium]|nr:molybdopterin-guanine dinucleotide biosynthesis protein B [bacterium]
MIAICGFSGSGKTTLIEELIPRLLDAGISVAVIKHDAHGAEVDKKGKDSARFFRAGADVALEDPKQVFIRLHRKGSLTFQKLIDFFAQDHDLILVEGHKDTNLPKIWLLDEGVGNAPVDVTDIRLTLNREDDRLRLAYKFILEF